MSTSNTPLVSSTPSFQDFDPSIIPYQLDVISDLWENYDYNEGLHEVLLSGSVGSAKSLLMAHIAIRHCVENAGARVMLGRKTMPSLKSTIFRKILEHLEGTFTRNVHYYVRESMAYIRFRNMSEIVAWSWADNDFYKVRSMEFSGVILEELTESQNGEAYIEAMMRVGRLPHVKQNFVIAATNPDEPSHWVYKYFMESPEPTRHVYYSVTSDNPFLPKQYIQRLMNTLDPKMVRRMVYGEWLSIKAEVVYYAYTPEGNYRQYDYLIDDKKPIIITFDFNIGLGKPMSACLMQYEEVKDEFHIYDESIIQGADTNDLLDDMLGRNLFDHKTLYIIRGDAAGKHKDTRSKRSDYDIIQKRLSHANISFVMQVPPANPPIRTRHNIVNGYCKNSLGNHRLFVYQKAKTVNEGMLKTALLKGASYAEDDKPAYQHVTTALGYAIYFEHTQRERGKTSTIQM